MDENIKEEVLSWIKLIATAFILAFAIKTFIFQIAFVKGPSMQPTLYQGQVLIVSKLSYRIGIPKRGEIVVINDKLDNKDLIKRVIGEPGEDLEVKDGSVYIDGNVLSPDYTEAPTYENGFKKSKTADDEYFVLGDNRVESRDSRSETLGFVKRKSIIGKAVFRLWPLKKFGVLK